jgi:hypothetical protein
VAVAGQQFALTLTCRACRQRQPVAHVHRGDWRRSLPRCIACGGAQIATGFDLLDQVAVDELPEGARNRSLTELGMLTGDVLTLTTAGTDVHVELCGGV